MFEAQPYMNFGVSTDGCLRAMKDRKPVENLYAAGSVLSGCNSLKEGSGAGVAIISALHVSESILKK